MKRLVSMVVVLMLVVSAMAPSFADVKNVELKDVPKNHWSYQFVQKAINYGLMEAPNGVFDPNKEVTRIEFMKAVAKMYMPEGVTYTDPESMEIKKYLPDYDVVRYLTDSNLYMSEKSIRRDPRIHDIVGKETVLDLNFLKPAVEYYNSPIQKIEVAYIIAALASSRMEVMNKGSRFRIIFEGDGGDNYTFAKSLANSSLLPHLEPLTKRTKLPAFTSANVENKNIYWNGTLMFDKNQKKYSLNDAKNYTHYNEYINFLDQYHSFSIAQYMYDQNFFVNPNKDGNLDYGQFNPQSKISRAAAAKVLSMVYDKTSPKSTEMKMEDIHARIIVKEEGSKKILYVYGNVGNIEAFFKSNKDVTIIRVKSFKEQQNIEGRNSYVLSYVPYTPGYVVNGKKYSESNQKEYVNQLNDSVFTSLTKLSMDSYYYTNPQLTFNKQVSKGLALGYNGAAAGYFQAVYGIYAPAKTEMVDFYTGTYPEGTIIAAFGEYLDHLFAVSDTKNGMFFEGSDSEGYGTRHNKNTYNLKDLKSEQQKYNSIFTVTYFDKNAYNFYSDYRTVLIEILMSYKLGEYDFPMTYDYDKVERRVNKITQDKERIKFYMQVFGY